MQSFSEKPNERTEAANLVLIRIERAVERRGRADARNADVALYRMATLSPLRGKESR